MKQYLLAILVLFSFPLMAYADENIKVYKSDNNKLAEEGCHSCFVTSKDREAALKVFIEACDSIEKDYFIENINSVYYISTEEINYEKDGYPFSCEDKCIDTDGDGWGWNSINNESCEIKHYVATAGECIDTDGDGWGWNGVSSCKLDTFAGPVRRDCVDTDGDGWGWDGIETCQVSSETVETDTTGEPAAPVEETIIVEETESEGVVVEEIPVTVQPSTPSAEAPAPVVEIETTEDSVAIVEEAETEEETVNEDVAVEETLVTVQSGTPSAEAPAPVVEIEATEDSVAIVEEVANPPLENTAAQEVPETPISAETETGPTLISNTQGVTLEPAEDEICADENGDGWGWDGEKSCRVLGFVDPLVEALNTPTVGCAPKTAGTTLVSSASSLGSTGDSYYADAGPQCVYFGNQYNGPGLFYGDFKFSNNAWNAQSSSFGDATDEEAPSWEQCISLKEKTDGTFSAHLTFDWGNEYQINKGYMEWAVKSYPNLLFGTSARGDVSGDCETTGLPIAYKDIPKYTVDFKYSASNTDVREGGIGLFDTEGYAPYKGADRNVAIESFFHTTCDIKRNTEYTASNKEYEIMVWLEKGLERVPSGDPSVGVFTDSKGQVFDVFTKPRSDDGYLAYVARDTLREGSLEWNDFIEDARANSEKYGIKPFNDSWCLGNIMLGSEIWWGQGEITVDEFKITSEF